MGAVAGAEPAAVVAGLADGDTAEMRADACFLLVHACEIRALFRGREMRHVYRRRS